MTTPAMIAVLIINADANTLPMPALPENVRAAYPMTNATPIVSSGGLAASKCMDGANPYS
ncbi:hypothetical protein [Nitrobacter winogradskyi]|uniref:hypothetical protein n=1 Tax=Nitrobacter winogradskyi TaxID=913 RepID=UPI0011D0F849|nr:hypothetical protein [Nitrobacter winogradskyi]